VGGAAFGGLATCVIGGKKPKGKTGKFEKKKGMTEEKGGCENSPTAGHRDRVPTKKGNEKETRKWSSNLGGGEE